MARPKDADSGETMAKILGAALDILREDVGPKPPPLRAVARRANVSLNTIRYYFDTKDELHEACLDGYYERLTALGMRLAASSATSTDARTFIEDSARALFRFVYEERNLVKHRLATNSVRGELHPRRQRDFMGAFIGEAGKALDRFIEVDALDARLSIQAVASMIVRFALLSDSERGWLTSMEDQEASKQAVEDYVVQTARRLVRPGDG